MNQSKNESVRNIILRYDEQTFSYLEKLKEASNKSWEKFILDTVIVANAIKEGVQ